MAIFDTTWYLNYGDGSTTGYYAVPQWAALHAYSAGSIVRQLAAPAVNSERIFACIIAGTSLAAEPTWVLTYGAKTAESAGPTWMEITGRAGVNGDTTNAGTWTASRVYVLGQLIYDSVTTAIQIITTAGTAKSGSPPSFSATAGVTTTDNTATWTSLGLAGGFAAWANPSARLATLLSNTFMIAGNICYVAKTHAETQASVYALISGTNGTAALPLKIICTDTTNAPPQSSDVTIGASVSTTGASALTLGGSLSPFYWYMYGLTLSAGSAANAATLSISQTNGGLVNTMFDNCTFKLNNTATTSRIAINGFTSGAGQSFADIRNCAFVFGNASQSAQIDPGVSVMQNCTFAATGTVPTTLFGFNGNQEANIVIRDCDISAVTGTLMALAGNGDIYFENCKFGSGVTLSSGTAASQMGTKLKIHNCDSGSTNYRYADIAFGGTIIQETTIVRTGSLATDNTTPISWNVTTNANPTFYTPFVSEEISVWNDTTGSTVTITLYLISNTTLNNNDFWAEAGYAGTSSFPLGLTVSNRMAILGTPAALTSDTSTWGGSTNKYKIVITCIPQNKGPLKVRFYAAKASATTYVDPYIYLS